MFAFGLNDQVVVFFNSQFSPKLNGQGDLPLFCDFNHGRRIALSIEFLLKLYLHLPQINLSHLYPLQSEVFRVLILVEPRGQARDTFHYTRGGILSESLRQGQRASKGR